MIPQSHNTQAYRCLFTDGREFTVNFLELARKQPHLSFNMNYLRRSYVSHPLETPFREIRIALPGDHHIDHPILQLQPQFDGTLQEFIIALKEGLKKYLLRLDTSQKYLMLHSSGTDSRFISGTLAELRREGFVLDIHFRCHPPECEQFRYIMKKSGWEKSQYSCWEHSPDDFYDIGKVTPCVQGWQSYSNQMNFWSDLGDEKDYIVITGEGGELFKYLTKYPNPPYQYTDNYFLNMLIDHNPGKGEWECQFAVTFKDAIMPLWSFDYLAVSNRVRRNMVIGDPKTGWDNIRTMLVKSVGLGDIVYKPNHYTWNISDKRKNEMRELFYGGRFYRDMRDHIPAGIDFFTNPSGWDSALWAFAVTVYDQI